MQTKNLNLLQPRNLRYRNHYKFYVLAFGVLSALILLFWANQFYSDGWQLTYSAFSHELIVSGIFFTGSFLFYFLWLRSKLNHSVQVFNDHILIQNGKKKEELWYSEVESICVVCWSIFYIKMNNGLKYYFNSSLERVDYIWEGIHEARPDLFVQSEFEEFRVKLVQYDHHQKRKEWFFKHKMVDVFNWILLPVLFIILTYMLQSKYLEIHQQALYFFRLFMFSMLALLITTFIYSIVLKKTIFDKKISSRLEESDGKVRDLEFEGVILQRSKLFQFATTAFILCAVAKFDVNLYSLSKVKEDIAHFQLKQGHTIWVDNRYNCVGCTHSLKDGDLVVFGRGTIGQVFAKEGEKVGQLSEDAHGRTIASENIHVVPSGHVAVKAANGKDIIFVRMSELVGRIQK